MTESNETYGQGAAADGERQAEELWPLVEGVGWRSERLPLGTLTIHGDRAVLFTALAKAQAGYQPIPRSRTVKVKSDKGDYTFDYAPLEEVLTATLPALNANGLALLSVMGDPAGEGEPETELHTLLTHESGAFIHTCERLPHVGKAQERGSQVTYRRRYQTGCLTGTSPEFDDDGNATDGNKVQAVTQKRREPPPPPQRAQAVPAASPQAQELMNAKPQQRAPVEEHPHKPIEQATREMSPEQKATFTGPTVFPERSTVLDEPLSEDTGMKIRAELVRCGFGKTSAAAKVTEVCGQGKDRTNLTEADGMKLLRVLNAEVSKS